MAGNAATDKIATLTKYVEDMKSRLTSPVPAKRKGSEASYHAWIRKEIELHTKKIEQLKMK